MTFKATHYYLVHPCLKKDHLKLCEHYPQEPTLRVEPHARGIKPYLQILDLAEMSFQGQSLQPIFPERQ
jgi:hypothetical protein